MLKIEKIINSPVSSNCYVISTEKNKSCIVVDPGTENCKELLDYLQQCDLYPNYIVLTHEHVDHIIGCEELQKHYDAKIVCSSNCASAMQSSRFNLTRMTEQWEERMTMPAANIKIEDIDYQLVWGDYVVKFYLAEGHSIGSIYFTIGDKLFIGDTLIKGYKTTTTLPGGSREKLVPTLEYILHNFEPDKTKIYPGHFDSFYLKEVLSEIYEQIEYLKNKIHKKNLRNQSVL